MLLRQFRLGNILKTLIRVNTDFSTQKPQQLLSDEVNFKDCSIFLSFFVLEIFGVSCMPVFIRYLTSIDVGVLYSHA